MIIGIHAVQHALQSNQKIKELIIQEGKRQSRVQKLIGQAQKKGIPVSMKTAQDMDKLCDNEVHQGVIADAVAASKKQIPFKEWLAALDCDQELTVLVLDQVSDPHNLGACIRSAEGMGCQAVMIPMNQSAKFDAPAVGKAACGAMAHIHLFAVTNLSRSLEQLQKKGFWVYGLAGEAKSSVYDTKFDRATVIVMGAEDTGMRPLVRQNCDQLLHIPMKGEVESLNVSVATGVTLSERVRQSLCKE
ncbi:MAG: 23S rRNA (guanosine(2251)-2'-O)-methyltransferase RlmB [Mariprofundaceae bacterium]|nr:23S rRNA (guanosine(2251)-2'-O)-methyltransferase RlmB [Mariprofundaceae bacterium]